MLTEATTPVSFSSWSGLQLMNLLISELEPLIVIILVARATFTCVCVKLHFLTFKGVFAVHDMSMIDCLEDFYLCG